MCLAPEVQSQRRRLTLLEMTSARSGLEIAFKLDGQSAIFAWTKRPSSVKWAVSALPSGAHPANLRRKTDAQSLAHPCDRVAVRRIGGAYRRRANLARGQ